ncbi:MAG TPA: phosphate ABC transporter substrate-binding protein [Blastocatellia bacterium]
MRKKSASNRRRGAALLLVVSVVLLGLIACGRRLESESNHPNERARLVIQNIGSDTMVNLAQAWAEEYAAVEPAVSVEVSGGGTGTGVAALINGTADIANCSRQMEAGEIAKVSAAGWQKPKENIVGYDALAIFAHKGNPLEEITIGQLAAIYGEKGQIRSWADLGIQVPGCQRGEMILVSRQSNSGTYYYFREAVLGKGVDFKLGTIDLHGSKDVVELVSRTPCAIGYSGMGYATPNVKTLRVARKPGETAFAPNVENTQGGKYPIARPLYMYTRGEPKDEVKKYINWVQSEAGQSIVRATGYVPILKEAESRAAAEQEAERP